jgi:hypothetical protein
MEESPLAIRHRIKLPDEILWRINEIETAIPATVTDNRIKTILSTGCTAYRADWMQDRMSSGHGLPIFSLWIYDERDQVIRTAFCDFLVVIATGSVEEPPRNKVRDG